jgi:D-lactate dehydrogenase (cytochrome)
MDLVDLFIGSEGTLGAIAEVILRTAPLPGGLCRTFVPVPTEAHAIALVADLRSAAIATWASRDEHGIDVSAIEHLDARAIQILRDDGADRRLNITLPRGAGMALLVDLEMSEASAATDLWSVIASSLEPAAIDSPLTRFCRLLDRHGVFDAAEITLPGERSRAAAFADLREAVPAGVNRRVALAKQRDPGVSKTAADMIVPFERFGEMLQIYRDGFASRGLDFAVWGHISDGNVHPNVIPRSYQDVERGKEAILLFGGEATRLGGCPLAEHGVGRNPVKQALLRDLYGEAGIDQMRAVKRALDPDWKLAPGVIFNP